MREIVLWVLGWLKEHGIQAELAHFYGSGRKDQPQVMIVLKNVYWGKTESDEFEEG